MRRESRVRNSWRKARNLALPGALALGILFLPATAVPAEAGGRVVVTFGNNHAPRDVVHVAHHSHQRKDRAIRVVYHRADHRYATYAYLSTPYVVLHGPRVAARVVGYPAGAPAVYEPGYCVEGVHYHPYTPDWRAHYRTHTPDPGVHSSFAIRIGF